MEFLQRIFSRVVRSSPTTTKAMTSSAAKFDVRRVAVIGAGPCGLAAAKYLKAQGTFDKVDVYEQQDEVGGVWYYSRAPAAATPVPQTDPFLPPDEPVSRDGSASPIFSSPMYEDLHANIPIALMKYSDHDFAADEYCFPRREKIQEYMVRYAAEVRDLIRFRTRVRSVDLQRQPGDETGHGDKWLLEAQSTVQHDDVSRETYDAVVLASGHYSTAFVPEIAGLAAFNEAHPGVVSHSKAYRTAHEFAGKKVIVVGNGPSGTDIAYQINLACRQPALLSVRHPTLPERLEYTGCREVAEIVEFLPADGPGKTPAVRLADGSVETDVDAVVFCTGFLYSFPYLPRDLQRELITDGRGVHGLYQHLVAVDHPTLAFPCLNIMAIPWPLGEVQASVLGGLWSNQLDLPPREEMRAWSERLDKERAPRIHLFQAPEDGHYLNEMHDWALQARGGPGKTPPRWGDYEFWLRSLFAIAKLRFEKDGSKAKTLEELGLVYQKPGERDDKKEAEVRAKAAADADATAA